MNVIILPNGRRLKKKMFTTIWKTFAQASTSEDMDGTPHLILFYEIKTWGGPQEPPMDVHTYFFNHEKFTSISF